MKEKYHIYLQSLAYFILATLIVALSTLLLHEAGHAAFGLFYNCSEIRVIAFDSISAYPYTEMTCENVSMLAIGLSSFIFVLPFLIFTFLMPRIPERFLPVMMLGFNTMISAWDLQTYLNDKLFFPIFFIGTIILLAGEVLFMEEEGFFIKHAIRRKGENIYD